MKTIIKTLVLAGLAFVWACGPKTAGPGLQPPAAETTDAEAELLARADSLFQFQAYAQALETYQTFMQRFPTSARGDAALMKIAAAYRILGQAAAACDAYDRLVREYPESLLLPDAWIETLTCLFEAARYTEILDRAAAYQGKGLYPAQQCRLSQLVGDTWQALGQPVEAFYHYALALEQAAVHAVAPIEARLDRTVSRLSVQDIRSLLYRLDSAARGRGYLLFQMGTYLVASGRDKDALDYFSRLVDRFPDHAYAARAGLYVEEIQKRSLNSNVVGCLLPLTGPYKAYGQRALDGIALAAARVAARQKDFNFRLIVRDSGAEPEKAAAAVADLTEEGAMAIIGPMAAAEAAARQAQRSRMPIVVFSQKNAIPGIGDFVFRNFIDPRMQVKALTAYAFDQLQISRVAILYPDDKYGRTFMQLFWDEILAHDGSVVGVEAYGPRQTDFADAIKKLVGLYYEPSEALKEELEALRQPTGPAAGDPLGEDGTGVLQAMAPEGTGPEAEPEPEAELEPEAIVDFDAVFIPDAPNKVGLIVPQMAFYDIRNVHLLGTNLWHSDRLIEMSGEFVQGAVVVDGFFESYDAEPIRAFNRMFGQVFNKKPGFIEAVAYDTALMVLETLEKHPVRFRSDLRDRLLAVSDYRGITGLTGFDPNGDSIKQPYLLRIRGKRFVTAETGPDH